MWQLLIEQIWSIVAALTELLGIWMVGYKKKTGFLVLIVANSVWMYVSVVQHVYGILLVTITANIIHTRSYFRWRKHDRDQIVV
jgi:nicotinamide riboside transporter PnuC